MIGQEVGNYILEKLLGKGGMGEVYLGRHKSLGRRAAIKVMSPAFSNEPQLHERFAREARTQAQLQHPNIAQVLDHVEQDGRWFLVIEYMENGTLGDRLGQLSGPLPVEQALAWARQALLGLDHAHQKGVVHRDVKPANLLINERGEAAVTDFGIAMEIGAQRLTSTGVSIGTPEYMSPEQIRGVADLDHRTDLYSMGVVLYELLTGRVPFQSPSTFEVQRAQVTESPPPLRQINPSIAPELEALVMRALAKDPAGRYASCGDFARALEIYERGAPNGPSPSPPQIRQTVLEAPGFNPAPVSVPPVPPPPPFQPPPVQPLPVQPLPVQPLPVQPLPVQRAATVMVAEEPRAVPTSPTPPPPSPPFPMNWRQMPWHQLPWRQAAMVGAAVLAGILLWSMLKSTDGQTEETGGTSELPVTSEEQPPPEPEELPLTAEEQQLLTDNASPRAPAPTGNLRYTIMVSKFENESGQRDVGRAWETILTDELNQTGRFIVVAEEDMRQEAGREQGRVLSGVTAQGRKGAVAGQMTPVQLLVKGVITHFQHSVSGNKGKINVKGFGMKKNVETSEINVTLQFVDSTTGIVVASKSVVGKARKEKKGFSIKRGDVDMSRDVVQNGNTQTAIRTAVARGVKWMAGQLDDIPWRGSVVLVKKDKLVYINRGSREGVSEGNVFRVGESETVRDPDTGEVLDESVANRARIQAIRVKRKTTICKLIGGESSAIYKGMGVSPQ